MAPLLSVVIPTKDRLPYAVHCLRTLARLPGDMLEVVLQDNSATPDLGRSVAEAGDHRVHYEHRPEPLSVIENCSLGMDRARGEYVTLLGDDDGVTLALAEVTAWAAARDLDAVTPNTVARYVWPDVRFALYGSAFAGRLTVRPYTGRVTEQDPEAGVRRSLHEAFQDLTESPSLPKLYYGIVHRRCLEALRREAGSIFPGVSPDMSAAMGLSKYVRRFVSVDFPIFLPGSSARSTAGAHARKEHVGRLEDQPHLPRNCASTWPPEIPAVFAVQTVWAQSAIAALRATGRGEIADRLDPGHLHALTGVLNRGMWPAVLSAYWRTVAASGRSRGQGAAGLARGFGRAWALRGRYAVGRLTRHPWYVGEHRVSGLETIADAVMALEAWTRTRGVPLALSAAVR
jgi:hypothetical protein